MRRQRHPAAWLVLAVALIALGVAALGRAGTIREITILHLNDLHARLRPDGERLGGFPHLAALLREERAAAGASLTLLGGDLVQGTALSTIFAGVPIFELTNYLGVDVACLGNHEFDYGPEKIPAMVRAARYPVVAANVVSGSGDRLLEPYVVRDVGGVRVAIVGALLEGAGPWGPWRTAPIVRTLRPIVAEAKRRSDLVVVLGHVQLDEMESVLRELPEVGVVVAGHHHSGLPEELRIGSRVGVKVQAFGREVGRLRLKYDTAGDRVVAHEWTRIRVDASRYPADPGTDRAVGAWESKLSSLLDVPIGRSSLRMERDEVRAWIQRVLRERHGADVGFLSRFGVRDAIPQGQLLKRHMWNVSPLDDRVVTLEVSGARLLEVIRHAEPPDVDPAVGPIVRDRTYRVATVDFVAGRWAAAASGMRLLEEDALLADVLIDWVKDRRVIP